MNREPDNVNSCKDISLWTAWSRVAEKKADQIAVVDAATGPALTCSQLTHEAGNAAEVIGDGKEGRIIAFSLPNGIEWLALFLAIQKIRAIALPLDASLNPDAQKKIAHQIGAHVLWRKNALIELNSSRPNLCNSCYIKLTSGSTGNLKPVFCGAKHLLADGWQVVQTMKIRPSDRNLAVIPLGHSYGLGNLVMPLILQGTAVVCAPPFVPRQIFDLIEQHRATVLPAVPAIFRALAGLNDVVKPSSLRLAISAGAPLSAEIAREFHNRFGMMIHNFYGSSETGGICYDRTGRATLEGRGVGKPMSGVKVTIRKDQRVAVSSPAVVPEKARGRVSRFILADLGQWNGRGELKLIGRVGITANIGGKKVHPVEVENHIRKINGVSDAWVTVMQDNRGDDFLAAAIETNWKQSEIENDLAGSLPSWKLPKRYLIQKMLPCTARGKLDVPRLKMMLSQERYGGQL